MLYEGKTDRLRQTEAMHVLSRHFKREFKQTVKRASPYDFCTATKGCVCEHKYRHYRFEDFDRFGGCIWLEIRKYNTLISLSKKRGDVPLFVVTLRSGDVIYADIRKIDTTQTGEATRNHERDDYDTDPCYLVPLSLFKSAGKARIFVRPLREGCKRERV